MALLVLKKRVATLSGKKKKKKKKAKSSSYCDFVSCYLISIKKWWLYTYPDFPRQNDLTLIPYIEMYLLTFWDLNFILPYTSSVTWSAKVFLFAVQHFFDLSWYVLQIYLFFFFLSQNMLLMSHCVFMHVDQLPSKFWLSKLNSFCITQICTAIRLLCLIRRYI